MTIALDMPPSHVHGSAKFRALHKLCPAIDCAKGFVRPYGESRRDPAICPACQGLGMVRKQPLELVDFEFGPEWPIELTKDQKLQALAYRYYGKSKQDWEPKISDFYTTPRADLELYQIVWMDDEHIGTIYRDSRRWSNGEPQVSLWTREDFLSPETFGLNRVHVPNWVLAL